MRLAKRAWLVECQLYLWKKKWEPLCDPATMVPVTPATLEGAIEQLARWLPTYRDVDSSDPDFFVFRIRNVHTNEVIPAEALGL